jgi:hypothetical protein
MKRAFGPPITALVAFMGLVTILLVVTSASVASAETPTPPVQVTPVQPTQAAPSSLTIVGQVSNATPGGSLPVTMTVTLYAVDGQQVAFTKIGTADASGKASFENVPYQSGRGFALVTIRGATAYQSELLPLGDGQDLLTVPLKIYDTTTDTGSVRIDQMYVIGQFLSDKELQVVNGYTISNAADRSRAA